MSNTLMQQSYTNGIRKNISLADKNWFNTGGAAAYFSEPTNAQEFQQALVFAQIHGHDIFVLGGGANILISDAGFNGLVIRPQITTISHNTNKDKAFVTAGAGVTIDELIDYCLDNNLLGLEEFSGIPGTVGGSVYINLHYFQFLLDQFLVSATIIHKESGVTQIVDQSWFNFGYNQSTLHDKKTYVVDATFKVAPCTDLQAAYARGRRTEIIRHRVTRYPSKNTCGSFFRNFTNDEVTLMSNGRKMIYVAYYLDKIGIKGTLKKGDALVSHQHANMLVNCGNATSHDIITLARTMQEKVYDQFGIIPQPECQLIGFDQYPLLKSK